MSRWYRRQSGVFVPVAPTGGSTVPPPVNRAPTAPGTLTATPAQTTVGLSWAPATDPDGDAVSYLVFRGSTQLTGSPITTTNYTATGLTASTTYTFTVQAIDARGLTGPVLGVTTTTTAAIITPPPSVAHGRQINATNTGIAKWGLTNSDLTAFSGTPTAGSTYYRRVITSGMTINADNVTWKQCVFAPGPSSGAPCVASFGANPAFEDCTIAPTSGSRWHGIQFFGNTIASVVGCDISKCENNLNFEQCSRTFSASVLENYLHDASNVSNPTGHRDCVELYNGANYVFRRNKMIHPTGETSVLNIAPWNGSNHSIDGVNVEDCYIDGGHMHMVVDLQATTYIRNLRFLRNDLGGHTTISVGGSYWAVNVGPGVSGGVNGHVQTVAEQASAPSAIVWPDSGADANHWVDCADLSPNRSGQIATWLVGAR